MFMHYNVSREITHQVLFDDKNHHLDKRSRYYRWIPFLTVLLLAVNQCNEIYVYSIIVNNGTVYLWYPKTICISPWFNTSTQQNSKAFPLFEICSCINIKSIKTISIRLSTQYGRKVLVFLDFAGICSSNILKKVTSFKSISNRSSTNTVSRC